MSLCVSLIENGVNPEALAVSGKVREYGNGLTKPVNTDSDTGAQEGGCKNTTTTGGGVGIRRTGGVRDYETARIHERRQKITMNGVKLQL